jgi:hypothetical protein
VVVLELFFSSIAREVKEDAAKHGVTCRYSPVLLTALFLAAGIAVRMLPASAGLLVTLVGPIPLLPVQAAINRVNAATSGGPPRAWRWWEIMLATVLGLFWLLILIGLLLPTRSLITFSSGRSHRVVDTARVLCRAPASIPRRSA